MCREVVGWSLELIRNLTNQIPNSACTEAINRLVYNLGQTADSTQTEPKAKIREIPKNYKNVVEKETNLEPKEVTYFVSEIEARFIEVARNEGVNVSHDLEGNLKVCPINQHEF